MSDLVLYSRQNCHLCDAFEAELDDFLQSQKVTSTKIDIDSQPKLQILYGNDVPVLTFEKNIICQHFFDKEKILKALS